MSEIPDILKNEIYKENKGNQKDYWRKEFFNSSVNRAGVCSKEKIKGKEIF